MPKIFADFHDGFLEKYLFNNANELKIKTQLVFPNNNKGFLVPC